MKKLAFFGIIAFAMAFSSCGGGNQQQQQVVEDDDDSTNVYIPQDQTIYGICGNGTAMNTLQLLTDNGDTLLLDLTKAQENYQVFGGLQAGDRMAVLPNKSKTEAVIVINQNTLLGDWVMPNPIDGSSEVGIRIKEGGIAESIDQSSIIYKTWRLTRGKLEIVLVREGGSEEEETYLYDITRLTPDSLVYKDAEDTFEYGRQKPKEQYGKNIVLEESSQDDFKM